jgi:histidine decarboxylase
MWYFILFNIKRYALRKRGKNSLLKEALQCIENSKYLLNLCKENGISAYLNDLSNTVVLERPKEEDFIYKWQLACKDSICHVVVMQNVTKEKLDEFVNDFLKSRIKTNSVGTVCIKEHVGSCLCLNCKNNIKISKL